jgi:outer membrane receptor protein involved in Fe transport
MLRTLDVWIGIAFAAAVAPAAIAQTVVAESDVPQTVKGEGIVVTAQKRPELIQDVPVPVTSLDTSSLVEANRLLVREYFDKVPGFTILPSLQSNQVLTIRGITTGFGNPTVAVMIDDVPFGASTNVGGGNVVPDLDPGDLARIEVLRGPQGTLYGASSMGGLLKFVTNDPSTDRANGRIQGRVSGVTNGADAGYDLRGSGNVPVGDHVAIRASGFTRHEPGYIDNPVRHITGLNEQDASGGQLSALWLPEPAISLKLTALFQELKGAGANVFDVLAGLGDLQQNELPGSGAYDRRSQAYIAVFDVQRGRLGLTSVTGYTVNQFTDRTDTSGSQGAVVRTYFGVSGALVAASNRTEKLTQELRATLPLTRSAEWVLGGFYANERSALRQTTLAEDPRTGVMVGPATVMDFPATYREFAGFTNVVLHATDRFEVQLGVRESRIKQSAEQTVVGPLTPAFTGGLDSPAVYPEVRSSSDAFTYLVTPRIQVTPEIMLYARFASGFRAGGPNRSPGGIVPAQYEPDKTQNYEVGLKGEFFSRRLAMDVSAYHIRWKDIQLQATNLVTTIPFQFNGGGARSDGVELAAQATPVRGTTLGGWVVWNDAVLTDPIRIGSFAEAGERLPIGSRFSSHLTLRRDFVVSDEWSGFALAEVSYVGDRNGPFRRTESSTRLDYPAYTTADLRVGIGRGSWACTLFVTNVTDERGKLNGGVGTGIPFGFVYITPRTYGVTLASTF